MVAQRSPGSRTLVALVIAIMFSCRSSEDPREAASRSSDIPEEFARADTGIDSDSATSIDTEKAVARLADPSPTVRRNAARYLVALLHLCDVEHDLLRAIEHQERQKRYKASGWRGYSFGDDQAESLRCELVERISGVVVPEVAVEAVDLVTALLGDSARRDDLVAAFNLVRQIQSNEADLLVGKILVESAGYAPIRVRALEEVARRGLVSERQHVLDLCMHYDARTRTAARAAAEKLNLGAPPEARTEDMLTGRLAVFLEQTVASTEPVVAPASRWVRIAPISRSTGQRVAESGATDNSADEVVYVPLVDRLPRFGRVVSEAKDRIAIQDWNGIGIDLPPDSDRLSNATAADAVALIVEWRRACQATDDDGLTQTRQPKAETWLPKKDFGCAQYLVGGWCFAAGEFELARTCVVPFLEATEDEDVLFKSIRDGLALNLEIRMLDQFVERRDYAEAVRIARRLESPVFDGFYHQELAAELAEQLPRRTEDFETLTLPSAASWANLRHTLSRSEQVEFLGKRLRLIYCRQDSIPGGCDYSRRQISEPSVWSYSQSHEAVDSNVINPFVELLEMKLAPEETIRLLPTLLSNDFVLGVDYPRFDFGRPKTLHRAAWVAGVVINEVLQEDVVDFELLTPARSTERGIHVEALRERLSKKR